MQFEPTQSLNSQGVGHQLAFGLPRAQAYPAARVKRCFDHSTIGAVLARSQILTARGHAEPLLLHPVLVLVVGALAISLGVPLSKFALTVVVLVAALPSASNVAMLAERYDADSARIARIIMVTTAAAFLTFSGSVALLT